MDASGLTVSPSRSTSLENVAASPQKRQLKPVISHHQVRRPGRLLGETRHQHQETGNRPRNYFHRFHILTLGGLPVLELSAARFSLSMKQDRVSASGNRQQHAPRHSGSRTSVDVAMLVARTRHEEARRSIARLFFGGRVVRGCRPLRAYCEVRAHIAPGELGAAAPTAFHPRPSGVLDEVECRVLLMLPYTNLTPGRGPSMKAPARDIITRFP
jgi:hypothetical protein